MRRVDRRRAPDARDLGFYAAAAVYALAVWWPTRELPYFWDGAEFVANSARILLETHFTPLALAWTDFAHPPLFVASLALAWRIFGESKLLSHLIVLPTLPVLLAATYRVGRRTSGRLAGAAAAALVATVPVVLAEYADIYLDLPSAALVTAGAAAWVEGRRRWAAAFFVLATLVKFPILVVPAAFAVALAFDRRRRRDLRSWAALLAPFPVVPAWFLYHWHALGWAIHEPHRKTSAFDVARILRDARWIADDLFVGQGRIALTVAAALAIGVVVARRRARVLRPLLPHAIVVAAGFAFFAVFGEFTMRYAIFALPSFAVIATTALRDATSRRAVPFVGIALATVALFVASWHPRRPLTATWDFRPADDLGYLDMIAIGRDAAHWMEEHHRDVRVYGSFPEDYQLGDPFMGYVHEKLDFTTCARFYPDDERPQLIYVHPYSPGQRACRAIAQDVGAQPLKVFRSNDKWLEIRLIKPGARPRGRP